MAIQTYQRLTERYGAIRVINGEVCVPVSHVEQACAKAWSEGSRAGFDDGQKDASGIEYTDAVNPYRKPNREGA